MNYSRLFHAIVVVGCTWAAPGCGDSDPGPRNVTSGEVLSDGGDDLIDHSKHDMGEVIDGGWHPTK